MPTTEERSKEERKEGRERERKEDKEGDVIDDGRRGSNGCYDDDNRKRDRKHFYPKKERHPQIKII